MINSKQFGTSPLQSFLRSCVKVNLVRPSAFRICGRQRRIVSRQLTVLGQLLDFVASGRMYTEGFEHSLARSAHWWTCFHLRTHDDGGRKCVHPSFPISAICENRLVVLRNRSHFLSGLRDHPALSRCRATSAVSRRPAHRRRDSIWRQGRLGITLESSNIRRWFCQSPFLLASV